MMSSAAWTALSDKAIWVYIELKQQYKYETGFSRLILPFSKVEWRMSRGTFYKKIKELIKYGFIRKINHGGLYKNPKRLSIKKDAKLYELDSLINHPLKIIYQT